MQTIKLEFRIGNAMRVWLCAALLLGGSEMSPALAALTDISDVPITGSSSTVVKPNIMLVMDTSGSMGWGHMPDEVESVTGVGSVGYKSSQCNVLYYNPTTKYLLPKDATGTAFPIPSFTAAPVDAFDTTSSTTIDLSSSFRAYQTATLRTSGYNDTPQPAYYYVYTGSQSPVYSASPCTDVDTGVTKPAIGGGTWTRVVVSATSGTNSTIGPDERTNFAIWYAYYRTRIAMVKSAVSLAFQFSPATTANYRLGFITVQPKTLPTDPAIDSTKYVPMSDFNSTQRDLWFTKIFAQKPGGASPAREALARAGRYYAGKHDGINTGMDDDPVQYSCQQNFTIMTTDGYWNAQTESQLTYPYIGGAVQMDGKTLVGNQDHYLTDYVTQPTGLTPRPIWEGSATGTRTITDNQLLFTAAPCTRYNISTSQVRSSTTQNLQSNVQNLQSTVQNLKSTVQKLQSTSQNLQSTSQMTQYTTQALQSTTQKLKSTVQNLQSTSQTLQQTQQLQRSTVQNLKSTVQNLKSTTQNLQSTVQNLQSTSQKLQSTVQNLKSTTQNLQSTSQMTQYTTQSLQSTTQNLQSTTQNLQSTTQNLQSTSQILSCNAATELCTPVASCTSGGNISCSTQTSGPTPVASCTPSGASAGNNYTSTTCSTNSTTNVHVASCTPVAASAVNNWTTTSCPAPIVTTNVPVASCTASGATSGNNYTITTCSTNNTSSVPVASCTASAATSGNNWTTTTCGNNTSATVAVSSCSPVAASSANSYTATVCVPVTTTNVPVASCTAQTAASGNSWTTITCPAPVVTTNVPVASCTAAAASSSNSYTTTTCPAPITTTNVPVASCTAAAASSSNNYTTTTCPAPITTTNVPVASCTAQTAASGNNWVTITCGNSNTTNVPVATCTPQTASSANSWTTITCPAPVVTTNVPVASCTAAAASSSNSYTTTTCPAPITTTNVPVASCTAAAASSSNSYTTTTCPAPNTTGPSNVSTCTAATASSSNNYTTTTCSWLTTNSAAVSTCTPVGVNGSGVQVVCTSNNTTNVPVASCTAAAASSSNNWTTTTCPTPNTTTNVPVASCTAAAASSSNSYTTTTCPAPITTTNVPVASCTAAAASSSNSYTTTTCPTPNTSATVAVSSCSPVAASSANSYTATVCVPVTTTNVPVASCTAQTAASGNSWTTITCPAPVVTTNVPVASCTAAAASSSNSYTTTTCPAPITTTNVPVASCTAAAASSSNNYTTTTCPAPITTTNVPVASCTAQTAASGNNWVTITCGNSNTTNVPVATCTPQTASSANSWNTITCSNNNTSNVLVASCNASGPSSGNGYTTTICTTSTLTGPTLTDTCTPVTASASNAYTATNCQSVSGQKIVYSTQTTVNNTLMSGGLPVGLPSISTTTSGASDLQTNTCYTGTVGDNLPTLPGTQEAGLPVSGFSASAVGPTNWDPTCTGWPCTITTPSNDGSVNSLADVAQYYYVNDLRPASDWPSNIAQDDVSAVGTPPEGDFVKWQHMVTFTMALGYSGTLNYRPDYLTATTGDFADIRCTTWNPPTTNPLTGVTTKTCAASKPWPEWPDPSIDYTNANNWNDPKSIDDFWHTAVNGRGQYFSAGSPLAVVSGMTQALSGISAQLGTGSAVGVSTLQPVVGDNYLFLASYKTSEWVGNVQELTVDPNTGAINTTPNWSAQPILDTQTTTNCDYRNIYLIRQGAPNNLTPFTWNTSACDATGTPLAAVTSLNAAEQANFNATVVHQLSQYTSPSGVAAAAQAAAAVGANLVNFLRGQRGLEGYDPTDTTYSTSHLYRSRTHVLGDIVDGSPTYVRAPYAMYQDGVTPSYSSFQAAYANRIPMLYVPANDGMLHAFYVGTSASDPLAGKEAWAIIPSTVLPNLYELADAAYSSAHRYFVDGTVSVGDAFDQNGVVLGGGLRSWRTIVVGGFNKGGQGYYAVDVTDPTTPRALWEFKSTGAGCGVVGANCDQNLGYSFGQPSITKLMNGQWVVIVTSGYNNVPPLAPNGDGHGYLYVLDAFTGQIISKIDTGVGSTTTPSGLAQASSFVSDAAHDNTTLRVYGGDLLGNVWRFNINAPTPTATLIGTAVDNLGVAQPISTAPELGLKGGFPIVLVGTGLLLGPSDLSNVQLQSVYGIVDPLTVPSPGLPIYNALRTSLAHDSMSIDSSGNRTTFCDANCNSLYGWLLDLPSLGASAGERVNVNMQLVLGTLTFLTNQPSNSACSSGGYSFDNYVNYANGLPVKVASLVNGNVVINTLTGYLNSNSLVTGLATLTAGTGGSTGTGGLGGTSTSGNSCTGSNCTIGIGGACNAGTDCINGVCTGPNCSMSQFTCALATGVNGIVTCNGIPVVPLVPDGKRVSWHEIVQ